MRFCLILFILGSIEDLYSQNLAPNGGFEKSSDCHWETWGTLKGADDWTSFRGSTDYLNECNSWKSSNFTGPQTASSGTGFAGFYAYLGPAYPNQREILGAKLRSPLIIGKKYYVAVKFSMAEGYSDSGCNNVGVLFLTKGYSSNTYSAFPCKTCLNYLPNYAHVYSENVIKDFINWTEVSGYFIADSAYTHIAIGNFFTDIVTITETIFPDNEGKHKAYYYVDDVSVIDPESIEDYSEVFLDIPNVFTPNNDGLNDLFTPLKVQGIENMQTVIYNRWGQQVYTTNNLAIEWDGNNASIGVYYWIINYDDKYGNKSVRRGWINLIR